MLIILGTTGMLGSYIHSFFSKQNYKTLSVTRSQFDAEKDDLNKLNTILKEAASSIKEFEKIYLINCIGLIPQKCKADCDVENLNFINGYFPIYLYNLCKLHDIFYIHPSTDCVFSGNNGPYNEISDNTDNMLLTDLSNSYRLSKLIADDFLGSSLNKKTCIIRTSIIGRQNNNQTEFLSLLEWIIKENSNIKTIDGYKNVLWNGITCLEYSKFLYFYIQKDLFNLRIKHIYSPTSPDFSKKDLLDLIKSTYNLDNLDIKESYKDNPEKIINKHLSSVFVEIDIEYAYKIISLKEQLQELKQYVLE